MRATPEPTKRRKELIERTANKESEIEHFRGIIKDL